MPHTHSVVFNYILQGESGEKSGRRQGGRRKRDGNVAAYHRAKSSKVFYWFFVNYFILWLIESVGDDGQATSTSARVTWH